MVITGAHLGVATSAKGPMYNVASTTVEHAVVRPKSSGKSFDCTFPKVCRGMFLIITNPAMKVVQMLTPSHVPALMRCMTIVIVAGTTCSHLSAVSMADAVLAAMLSLLRC